MKKMQPKQAMGWWETYRWSLHEYGCRDLMDCYIKPSPEKRSVWARDFAGNFPYSNDRSIQKLTITAAGVQAFSVAWVEYGINYLDKAAVGEKEWIFRQETSHNSYWYPLKEIDKSYDDDGNPVSITLKPDLPQEYLSKYSIGTLDVKLPKDY